MKYILTTLLAAFVLVSCQDEATKSLDEVLNSGDLEALRTKKEEVLKTYDSVANILGQLDLAIAKEDTLKKLPLVTTFTVNDTLFEHYIDIQGNVETDQNILIYPEYQGTLTRLYVKEGQRVSKGQLLAKIDDGGLSSQVAQMETQYQLAKTTYERQQRLWDQKIGSEIQYLQAKSNMEGLKNSVDQMKAQLGRTNVRAPFSGEIDQIITEQGQVVSPGAMAIMRIVNLSNMYVKASVPENYLTTISKGSEVKVTLPALNMQVDGMVKTVGNYINPSNRTFDIEIDIPNKDNSIKPNLVAKLEINNYSNEQAQLIPTNVIQENSKGEKFVFVVSIAEGEEATVNRKQIETGLKFEGQIEVLEGLEDGDIIVSEGALTLKDGYKIKIKETK
ncbi:MAG: efflux RND transporter periplasmic adaptor subunit [Gilvibacter sp.]